ncbi:LAMI_0H17260g1_1 [Lachancea mirantina]|uniref:LAMI_0H17260g1_1 n=1 Tax=Lachancea mirantina TaxID=1230905 RepID=A0A1G4KJB4_9SACH|nr:LAMI_0H17260g1_1 [Lachancea mirantina]
MVVWDHLEVSKAHVAYACVGVFSSIFSLVSLFVKERLYIGESTMAAIFGLIVGPHCLNWFNPLTWGNSDSITLEITRIVLCLQIFAVAVELPKKYMLKHWLSISMLLLPVMTAGWLLIALFVWILIPGLDFAASLLIAACVTATDPILAQSVVSGKFAQRVPGHLRNLLSAESGCNDGMAFPFIYLSLYLIVHHGNGGEIVKEWICITILYECIFGCILGCVIGYTGRRAIRFAEEKKLIDRESFLAFYVVLAFMCAGFGSILGVDDLLVSFAAGSAFAWDGWFSKRTEESKVSTVIDLLLNLAYFVYFGAIIPWQQFNDPEIGTNVWRLIILAFVVIGLRRIPAVLVIKPFVPDIKSWREAIFVGHFGPIGVGAVFAAILARSELEASVTGEETPLKELPAKGTKYWQLISCIWPITCFFIVTSIIVHGSSVAVITLGRHLNTITLTKTFTTHTTNGKGTSWMQRLPSLEKSGRSFSLQRIDTKAPSNSISRQSTIGNNGKMARPAGGMARRKNKLKKRGRDLFKGRERDPESALDKANDSERIQREKEAQAAAFALSSQLREDENYGESELDDSGKSENRDMQIQETVNVMDRSEASQAISHLDALASNTSTPDPESVESRLGKTSRLSPQPTFAEDRVPFPAGGTTSSSNEYYDEDKIERSNSTTDSYVRKFDHLKGEMEKKAEQEEGAIAYAEGNKILIENRQGEIIDQATLNHGPKDEEESLGSGLSSQLSRRSSQTANTLKKFLTPPGARKSTLIDEQNHNRYFAYKIDNELIIENEDGDVLRRYRINTHESTANDSKQKGGNSGVVAKALSAVGLSRKSAAPDTGGEKGIEPLGLSKLKDRKLTPAPTQGNLAPVESEHESEEEQGTDSDWDSDGDEIYESENEDSDSNDEPETAVERARRLTALGHVSAPRREDDEEESPPVTFAMPESPKKERDSTVGGVKAALERTLHK